MIAFVDDHRAEYGGEPICRVLPSAPSTYHEHAAKRTEPGRLWVSDFTYEYLEQLRLRGVRH